jgi:hypothetical protein
MKNETIDTSSPAASQHNRSKPRQGASTGRDAIVLEMGPEQQNQGRHRRRIAELGKLADVHKRVVNRLLERSIEKDDQPKGPQLTIVK